MTNYKMTNYKMVMATTTRATVTTRATTSSVDASTTRCGASPTLLPRWSPSQTTRASSMRVRRRRTTTRRMKTDGRGARCDGVRYKVPVPAGRIMNAALRFKEG